MPAPKPPGEAVTRHRRTTKDQFAAGGWKGPVPHPPDGIGPAATEAWGLWFGSWWAGLWCPADVPILRLVCRLLDEVESCPTDVRLATELRHMMSAYGISPAGRVALRWYPPAEEKKPAKKRGASSATRLRVVDPQAPGSAS